MHPVTEGNLITSRPIVSVGVSATPLAEECARCITRVVVDAHRHLPDMFEITFQDRDSVVLGTGGLGIGTVITIAATAAAGATPHTLIVGEIVAIEGVFAELNQTVVRGYSADHRLQRRRLSRTFLNMKDSDIARQVATDAGLTVGQLEQTRTAHEHVGQLNQTDWEFLRTRAVPLGYEFGMAEGTFFFRKGAVAGDPVPLEFPDNLRTFLPRLTAGNAAEEVEVRVWDPLAAEVVTSVTPTTTDSIGTPAVLAAEFAPAGPPKPPPAPGNPALGDLGPAPSERATVVNGWPAAVGAAISSAAGELAAGLADHLGTAIAEAEAEAVGDPRLRPGVTVDVSGVAAVFAGQWVITRSLHVFDQYGYQTRFEVSGRQERSILGLTTGGAAEPGIPGLVCGIVSNINDPLGKCRVRVTLPWLSPRFESDWAPVAHPGAGPRSAALFQPEVGDEVLVGFELGDARRPYVLGGIVNNHSGHTLGGPPVKASGAAAAVVWRGIVSPTGNRLAFHDELPPGKGNPPPTASDLVLGTGSGNLSLAIDQTAGTVMLRCDPKPPGSKAAKGTLTIEVGAAGVVNIKAGAAGSVNVDGGAQVNITATTGIKIDSKGPVEIKGNPIKLN